VTISHQLPEDVLKKIKLLRTGAILIGDFEDISEENCSSGIVVISSEMMARLLELRASGVAVAIGHGASAEPGCIAIGHNVTAKSSETVIGGMSPMLQTIPPDFNVWES